MANIKKTKRNPRAGKDVEQLRLYTLLMGVSFGKSTLENCFALSTNTICNSSKLETTQIHQQKNC